MKITVHFSKIKDEIIANIKKAHKSIKVAVAWFTDEDIIRALSQKKEKGIEIEVVISNAKENFENINNFKVYLRLQAKLFIASKPFLHHKFCIIDDSIIINGSYNWSYAAKWNEENIIVITLEEGKKDDEDILKRFIVKHKFLCDKCSVFIPDIEAFKQYRQRDSKDIAAVESKIDESETRLRQEFEDAVKSGIENAKFAGITLSPFLLERMAIDGGGVEFVKRILHDEINSGEMKSGFKKLEEHIPNRVDLSFEYLVSRPKFVSLFSAEEVEFCKKLMAKYRL